MLLAAEQNELRSLIAAQSAGKSLTNGQRERLELLARKYLPGAKPNAGSTEVTLAWPGRGLPKRIKLLRMNAVREKLNRGWGSGKVAEYFGNAWGITTRQVENYIASVKADQRKRAQDRDDALMGMQLDRLDELLENPDREKLAVIQEQNKLLGLYPAQTTKLEHTGANGGALAMTLATMTDEELDRLEAASRREQPYSTSSTPAGANAPKSPG